MTIRSKARPQLRLPIDMIEALRREGAKRALPYQTLIRMWLKGRLDAESPDRDR